MDIAKDIPLFIFCNHLNRNEDAARVIVKSQLSLWEQNQEIIKNI